MTDQFSIQFKDTFKDIATVLIVTSIRKLSNGFHRLFCGPDRLGVKMMVEMVPKPLFSVMFKGMVHNDDVMWTECIENSMSFSVRTMESMCPVVAP